MVMANKNNRYATSGNNALKVQKVEKKQVKKVKKVKQNRNIKAKLKFIKLVAILFFASIFTLSRFALIMKMNANVRELKKQVSTVKKENENLIVDLAKINNIKNIETMAVTKYNMVNPKTEEVNFVDVKQMAFTEKNNKTTFKLFQRIVGLIN